MNLGCDRASPFIDNFRLRFELEVRVVIQVFKGSTSLLGQITGRKCDADKEGKKQGAELINPFRDAK